MFSRYEGRAWEDKFLPRLTSKQIGELPKENALCILSLGAVEQHGYHLPVMTDALIGEATLTQTFEKIDSSEQIWMLPPIAYGKSNEHLGFAGTIALSAATLQSIVMDVAASLQRSGFRRLLLFNTHGGNMDMLNVIAREVRIATGLMVFYLAPHSLDAANDLMTAEEIEYGIHGGDYETSIVKAIKPGWVHDELAVSEMVDLSQYEQLTLEGRVRFAWVMSDISESGVAGDATKATADKGVLIQERITDFLAKAFVELSRFEISELGKR